MIPIDVSGSRLPVGSSASSSGGWLTNARAIETRCCSPPESWSGKWWSLVDRPVRRRMSGHLGADLLARAAGDLQRVGDVVVHRAVGQQLEVLEDDAEVAAVVRHLLARDLGQVAAGDADRPGGRLELLDQQAHDRRLARARRADEEDELAAPDGERGVVETHPVVVALADAAKLDDRRCGRMRRLASEDFGFSRGHTRLQLSVAGR